MKEMTLRELRDRINKLPEEKLDKDLDDLYLHDKECLNNLFNNDSDFDIVPWWDYDD